MLKATYDVNNNGIVDNAEKVNNHTVEKDVPANAVFTDTTYSEATTSQSGLMSSTDKSNLDSNTSARHTHSNKSTLDGISSSDISNWNGKQNATDNSLTTTNKTITPAINEVNSIAKGANQALSYANYQAMITAFNSLDDDEYNVGQNIYIVTTEVPDLWISSVESTSSTYTYVDDATFVNSLVTNGYVQVGYYKVSMLETQKVDLTDYVKNTDYASNSKAGLIRLSNTVATDIVSSSGVFYPKTLNYTAYDSANNAAFISKGTLENVITGKGLVSNTDYASGSTAGVVKSSTNYGTQVASSGIFYGSTRTYSQYNSGNSNIIVCKGTLENVIEGKNIETANNKVTSISSSSTDTQYPSAKCVYDYIDNKVAIFNWDGQSSQDNSDNITLFQGIYDEQKERNCIVIVNSEPDEPCGCILNVPKNSMTYTTNNSAHEGYIIGNAYQDYQSVINGSYSMNVTNFPCAGYIVEAEEITTVSQFFVGTKAIKFLDTSYNYPTPYTPTYNGSPATKKYVDDRITKTAVTAYPTDVLTSVTSENQVVVLGENRSVGNKLTVTNNAIRIEEGVSKVLISAQIYYQDYGSTVDYIYPNITINGNIVARGVCSRTSGATVYQSVNIPPFLVSVQENDLIRLTTGQIHPTNQGKYRGKQDYSINTYITVEVIQ